MTVPGNSNSTATRACVKLGPKTSGMANQASNDKISPIAIVAAKATRLTMSAISTPAEVSLTAAVRGTSTQPRLLLGYHMNSVTRTATEYTPTDVGEERALSISTSRRRLSV